MFTLLLFILDLFFSLKNKPTIDDRIHSAEEREGLYFPLLLKNWLLVKQVVHEALVELLTEDFYRKIHFVPPGSVVLYEVWKLCAFQFFPLEPL